MSKRAHTRNDKDRSTFLPLTKDDVRRRSWDVLDIIIVTGDAYVDHPSYGCAVIGRVLEDAGYRVGIIAQPDWRSLRDFTRLGEPRLFFGITAGNVDSLVANYTANKRRRRTDEYAPGGTTGLRPDRATIVYANKVKEAFGHVPIVIGGIEASLRRFAHYDYWDNAVRRSILLDARADILVYGMGERQIKEIARRLQGGDSPEALDSIRGTAVVRNELPADEEFVMLPSYEEVAEDPDAFNEAFATMYGELDPYSGRVVVQPHANRYVVQYPPPLPLTTKELDSIYEIDYARGWHPAYTSAGGVPGFETVRFSVISHRGCPGECSFCSLYFHQGRIVRSRSADSIVRQVRTIAGRKDFKGTITDIGGPTANLYMAECKRWRRQGACANRQCLMPEKCPQLEIGYKQAIDVWQRALGVPGVKYVFVGSGVRYDLLNEPYSDEYLEHLCAKHVSGQLTVAPEHIHDHVLRLMNKPPVKEYEQFVERFKKVNSKFNKKQYLVNYFITAHPGAGLSEALELALYLISRGIHPEQIQDFIPSPMTLSTCMYYTGTHPFTGEEVYVPKSFRERKMQRALVQYRQKKNKKHILEALKILNKSALKKVFFKKGK